MAVIVQTLGSVALSPYVVTETTMTASDTLTFATGTNQLLKIRNPTASSVTVILLGTAPVSPLIPGTGSIFSTASGKSLTIPAGTILATNLDKVNAYLQGTASAVAVTGGSGCFASLIQ